jgi:hypothetical protein
VEWLLSASEGATGIDPPHVPEIYGLDEKEAVPDNSKLTPGEANKIVAGMLLRKLLA